MCRRRFGFKVNNMAASDSINLFAKENVMPEYFKNIENQLKRTAVLFVAAVLVLGFTAYGMHFFLKLRLNALDATKTKLLSQLSSMSETENKYIVLKSRIGLAEVILNTSKPVGNIMDIAYKASPPPWLKSIEMRVDGQVMTNFHTDSVEDALLINNSYLDQQHNNRIKNTVMDSFIMNEKGIILINTFYPVW